MKWAGRTMTRLAQPGHAEPVWFVMACDKTAWKPVPREAYLVKREAQDGTNVSLHLCLRDTLHEIRTTKRWTTYW
jgi:hypothetical protein